MTVTARNRVIVLLFAITIPLMVLLALRGTAILAGLEAFSTSGVIRSRGLFQLFGGFFFSRSALAVLLSVLFFLLFSAIAQINLYWHFEKTPVPEVFYLSLFLGSLAPEALRGIFLASFSQPLSMAWALVLGRVLIFSRMFGLFSFLAASLVACNQDFRKHGRSSFAIVGVSLLLSSGFPLDTLSWLSNASPMPLFGDILFIIEVAISLLSCLSFLAASFIREAPELRSLSLMALMIVLGRDALMNGDSYLSFGFGALLLAVGFLYMVRRIHRYYLWI